MKSYEATFAIATLLTTASPSSPRPTDITTIRNAHLNTVVLPFHTNLDGLPLIDGSVDSTPGVFLIDTGSFYACLINRNIVPLEAGTEHGKIHSASGQKSVVYEHPKVHRIILADRLNVTARGEIDSTKPDMTLSIDAKEQQKDIDANLIGWIGWGFLKDYTFTLDYQKHIIKLQPINRDNGQVIDKSRRQGSIVIKFTPSSPVVPFYTRIDNRDVPTILDTAGWSQLALSDQSWSLLKNYKGLSYGPGIGCLSVGSAFYRNKHFALSDLEKVVRSDQRLTLGYNFLHDYTSIWDPRDGTVTLQPNRGLVRPRTVSCS